MADVSPLTSSTGRENDHWRAGGVIDGKRQKKLPVDVDLFLNEHGFDRKLTDFHRQHPCCVRANLIWFFCKRDTTDAGAPGHPGLNFDDDFAPYFRRCGHCLPGCSSRAAPWDFESVRGKNRFALIFVKSCHGRMLFQRS